MSDTCDSPSISVIKRVAELMNSLEFPRRDVHRYPDITRKICWSLGITLCRGSTVPAFRQFFTVKMRLQSHEFTRYVWRLSDKRKSHLRRETKGTMVERSTSPLSFAGPSTGLHDWYIREWQTFSICVHIRLRMREFFEIFKTWILLFCYDFCSFLAKLLVCLCGRCVTMGDIWCILSEALRNKLHLKMRLKANVLMFCCIQKLLQAASVWKLLAFPSQPPYKNSLHFLLTML